jgi:hypothetical protein
VEEVYLPEMEALLRGADESIDQVYFFDWRMGYEPNLIADHAKADISCGREKRQHTWKRAGLT